jgi:hypothetical protein
VAGGLRRVGAGGRHGGGGELKGGMVRRWELPVPAVGKTTSGLGIGWGSARRCRFIRG